MTRSVVLFVTMIVSLRTVCSDKCVVNKFEDFENEFTMGEGLCGILGADGGVAPGWKIGNYTSLDIEKLHEQSTTFIYPEITLSCVSSFAFPMSANGVLDVNAYIEGNGQISVVVLENGTGDTIVNQQLNPSMPNFKPGWNQIKLVANLENQQSFIGYIILMGMAPQNSIVLVDSFRYIPPNYNEDECVIYEEDNGSSSPTPPETNSTYEPTSSPTNGESDSTYEPTSSPTNSESDSTYEPTSSPTNSESDSTYEPTSSPTNSESDSTYEPTSSPTNSESDSMYEPTSSPTNSESDSTYEPTSSPTNSESDSTYEPTSSSTNGESDSTYEPTSSPVNSESDSTYEPTSSSINGESDSTYKPSSSPSNGESESTYGPTSSPTDGEIDSTFGPTFTSTDSATEKPPPTPKPPNSSDFWNPLTIGMVVLISLIGLVFICLAFFEIGKRKARRDTPPIIIQEFDYNNAPKPITVPRVRKVYTDSIFNDYSKSNPV